MLETFADDDCCGRRIIKASRDGKLADKESWTCPKCGLEWRADPVIVDGKVVDARHWQPHPVIAIVR